MAQVQNNCVLDSLNYFEMGIIMLMLSFMWLKGNTIACPKPLTQVPGIWYRLKETFLHFCVWSFAMVYSALTPLLEIMF